MSEPSFQRLLDPEVRSYLQEHELDDVRQLVLKGQPVNGVPAAMLAAQLVGRSKARIKIPSWYATAGILYPPTLSVEQCSSEVTAKFKSALLRTLCKTSEPKGADLTTGMGVDSWAFASWARMSCLEPQRDLQEITAHNFTALGVAAQWMEGRAEEIPHQETYDFIYADPSRRNSQQKVFRLEDCSPDVTTCLPLWLNHAPLIMLKASPLLDISRGLSQLKNVRDVWVVSVANECKELLFVIEDGWNKEPRRHAVELTPSGRTLYQFSFTASAEKAATARHGGVELFLYEPGAAVLKAGAFKSVAASFGLVKLAADSHLYTHTDQITGFPGKIFRVLGHEKLDGSLKGKFAGGYANVISRNHPLSVKEILKKSGLKEGGAGFLICTRDPDGPTLVRAEVVRGT